MSKKTKPRYSDDFARIDDRWADGSGDYVDEMIELSEARDRRARRSVLSSAWSHGRSKKTDPREVVFELLEIREVVSNFLKIHGVPRNTHIDLAFLGHHGKGCASFHDIGTFRKPYLLLDKAIYLECESMEVLDVYCGVGLHEASHLNHTREMFNRLLSGELKGERATLEGLFEDERIENLARKESPGYAPYLDVMKRALFEKKEFGSGLSRWAELPDPDKCMAVIFGVIRAPYALKDEQRNFKTLSGRCVFDEMREIMPAVPKSEAEVEIMGGKVYALWCEYRNEYKEFIRKAAEDAEAAAEESKAAGGLTDPTAMPIPSKDGGSEGSGGGSLAGGLASEVAKELGYEGGSGESRSEDSDRSGDSSTGESETDTRSGSGEETETEAGGDSAAGGDAGDESATGDASGEGTGTGDETGEGETEGGTDESGAEASGEGEEEEPALTADELEEFLKRIHSAADAFEDDERDAEELAAAEAAEKEAAEEAKAAGADDAEKVCDAAKEGKEKPIKDADKKLEKAKDVARKIDERRADDGRFGMRDLEKMVARGSEVTEATDADESSEMAKATEERIEFGDTWEPTGRDRSRGGSRRTVIVHPKVDKITRRRYQRIHGQIKNMVARMKQVFRFRLGTRDYKDTERVDGRLHRRQIAKAMSTDRLFYRKRSRTDKGIAICLLLDESGSMWSADHDGAPAHRALQCAMLIAEALRGVAGIELEVYSYSSCGSDHRDCLIKYLYGRQNPHFEGICGYNHGVQNYDHIAIRTAGDLFKRNTQNANRMMIVLSDGAPAGAGYGGTEAMDMVKREVDALRKGGMKVMQVAIEAFDSERMFGKDVIRFLDVNSLVNQMRKLVTRIVRSNTEG